jgi:hypothetical protein
MKTHTHLYWILAVFFYIVGVVYVAWSLLDPAHGRIEWAGSLGLILCGTLFALVAFYLGRVRSAQGGELVEDRLDSNIDDGDPEIGHFAPFSWWPLMLGGSIALIFLGIAIGFWISFFAIPLLLISFAGWTYEFYRGNFAR